MQKSPAEQSSAETLPPPGSRINLIRTMMLVDKPDTWLAFLRHHTNLNHEELLVMFHYLRDHFFTTQNQEYLLTRELGIALLAQAACPSVIPETLVRCRYKTLAGVSILHSGLCPVAREGLLNNCLHRFDVRSQRLIFLALSRDLLTPPQEELLIQVLLTCSPEKIKTERKTINLIFLECQLKLSLDQARLKPLQRLLDLTRH